MLKVHPKDYDCWLRCKLIFYAKDPIPGCNEFRRNHMQAIHSADTKSVINKSLYKTWTMKSNIICAVCLKLVDKVYFKNVQNLITNYNLETLTPLKHIFD